MCVSCVEIVCATTNRCRTWVNNLCVCVWRPHHTHTHSSPNDRLRQLAHTLGRLHICALDGRRNENKRRLRHRRRRRRRRFDRLRAVRVPCKMYNSSSISGSLSIYSAHMRELGECRVIIGTARKPLWLTLSLALSLTLSLTI